nr:unnamed protein product [Digitaria exilis]
MPRHKVQMGLIGEAAARARAFKGRKKGLKKKASELAILCGVDLALIVGAVSGDGGAPDEWEFGSAGVIDRYRRLPADKRAKHTHLGYLGVELGKEKRRLADERPEGPKALASPGKAALKGMDLEELLASIDAALLATARRRKALGVPDEDDTVVDAVPLGEAGVPFAGDGIDNDMEAWIDELTWHGDEPHPLNATMAQPAYGVHYINAGSMDMIGNQCLQKMGGNGESDHYGQQSWASYQQHNTVSYPGYGFQYTDSSSSYSDMDGCPQMPAPSNANVYDGCWFNQAMSGTDESPRDAIVPVDRYHHPSLDITGNHVYIPPEHSSMGMAAGDCFTHASSISLDGSFMSESSRHEYGNQCLADYFQCPDASQQFGEEPLHYLSDVAEGLRLWEN